MPSLNDLRIRIFADGADRADMLALAGRSYIGGLTTNPTLMRKAGIADYRAFAHDVLAEIRDKPVCFEVLADEFDEMERQAQEIACWGHNVYVKIPVTNTRREACYGLIRRLADRQVKLNVTAVMTLAQVRQIAAALNPATASFVSVFAGRIADTGVDPLPIMSAAVAMASSHPLAEIIWASPRELLNIVQADVVGCQIITVTPDILMKLPTLGYNLDAYSLDTVKMFRNAAVAAGFRL